MKNLLPTITCFIIASMCYAQTNIYDDFDSYKAGEFLGTESNGLWTTWTNAGGTPEDTYVTDQFSFSGTTLFNCNLVVWLMWCCHWDENSGSWTLSYMMFILKGLWCLF